MPKPAKKGYPPLIDEKPAANSAKFVDAGGARLAREVLFGYYSRERLMSIEARARFLEPDLQPLPPPA